MARDLYIGGCIGRGQFGEVYEARLHTEGGLIIPVAVKTLHGSAHASTDALARFRDEARLVASLSHEGIATAFDLCRIDGSLALISELVRGPDLKAAFLQSMPPVRAVLEAFVAVSTTLGDCHASTDTFGAPLRLVHRDVKPTNILISHAGYAKLIDFGVAWFLAGDRLAQSSDGLVFGSVSYMAPERFRKGASGHARWDVYALGASLYRTLAGRPVMGERGIGDIVLLAGSSRQWNQTVVSAMRVLRQDVPPPVWSILMRCLRHEGSERPSAHEVAEQLESAAYGMPGSGLRQWARTLERPRELKDGPFSDRVFRVQGVDEEEDFLMFDLP